MKDFFAVVFFCLLGLLGMLCISWVVQGNDFFAYRYFAPKQEAVRRQVFEQSKAYSQGMAQEIQNMQFQYVQADAAHKEALAAIILHRVADYDLDQLPPDTAMFVAGLRRTQEMGR
jgi:hypothetical protein